MRRKDDSAVKIFTEREDDWKETDRKAQMTMDQRMEKKHTRAVRKPYMIE